MDFTFSSRAGSSARGTTVSSSLYTECLLTDSPASLRMLHSFVFSVSDSANEISPAPKASTTVEILAQSCTSKSSWLPSTSTSRKAAALSGRGNDQPGWYLHTSSSGTFHEFHGTGNDARRKTAETAAQACVASGNGMNRSLSNAGRG